MALPIPMVYGSGVRTKRNRTASGLPKSHHADAACVGETVALSEGLNVLCVKARGHGGRRLYPFRSTPNPNTVRLKGKKRAKKRKGGFVYGQRTRRSGDGYRQGDRVLIKQKRSGRVYAGEISSFLDTPKPNAPRQVYVDCVRPERKSGRVRGTTDQLTLLQRADGYGYRQKFVGAGV